MNGKDDFLQNKEKKRTFRISMKSSTQKNLARTSHVSKTLALIRPALKKKIWTKTT